MTGRLRELSEAQLHALAAALRAGRLSPPYVRRTLAHVVGGPGWLADELNALAAQGLGPAAIAWGASGLAEERASWRARWAGVELTWTGPAELATDTRDTGAVARQLFASAERSLLVCTYALDSGAKGAPLLELLRARMADTPTLQVHFYVHLSRAYGDDRPADLLLREHGARLRAEVFPWDRPPRVLTDRRALAPGGGPRASLHAKVIVRDQRETLITSANLTEAAQERNVEAGVRIDDAGFARRVVGQFERLERERVLVEVPLG